jgi:hypothetical protein
MLPRTPQNRTPIFPELTIAAHGDRRLSFQRQLL